MAVKFRLQVETFASRRWACEPYLLQPLLSDTGDRLIGPVEPELVCGVHVPVAVVNF